MGEEKSRDIAGITVRYSDGSTKEIQSGCCVDLEKGSDDLSVEMLNVKPFDLVRLAYGLVAAVQRLGMRDKLEQYANGAGEGQDQTEEWLKPPEHINCRCTIYYPLDKKENARGDQKGRLAGNTQKEKGRSELWSIQRQ